MPGLIDIALEDFPRSEIWRLQTDGWQAVKGPLNFRPEFYKGMDEGFAYLSQHGREKITPKLIEDIYHSFYRYEEAYETDYVIREGYNTYVSEFEIVLPEPGLEDLAGVSLEGISELATSLKTSMLTKGSREYPFMYLRVERYGKPPVLLDILSNTFEEDLHQYLLAASRSKEVYTGNQPKPEGKGLCKVLIASTMAERTEVIQLVQTDIDNYYAELEKAKKITSQPERMRAEINAINHFIRQLHQSHYFPDGNGRTFVFLLANMLLLQNGYGMKIVEYPAHFAAYSTQELAEETMADMAHFQAYKITNAKNQLAELTATQITTQQQKVNDNLLNNLNNDPLIALAQTNELFIRVKNHQIHVPKGYHPKFKFLSILGSDSKNKDAHVKILDLLKDMYIQQLQRLIKGVPGLKPSKQIGFGVKEGAGQVLSDILKRHDIIKHCDEAIIKQAIEAYHCAVTGDSKQETTLTM